MKRIVAFCALLLTLVALFAACGDDAADEPPTQTATAIREITPSPTASATPVPEPPVMREPYEQLTYVGSNQIRLVGADGRGDHVFIEEPCPGRPPFWRANPWSRDGMRFAYLCPAAGNLMTLVVAADDGQEIARTEDVDAYKWSPGGTHLAIQRSEGEWPESEGEEPDITFEVAVLDVATGEETVLAVNAQLMKWVDSEHIMLGRELEFGGSSFSFQAYLHDLSGGSERMPRFDNERDYWVSPDGSQAIVLTEWSERDRGFGMAVYDFATGQERAIEGGYIGYGSDHIPDQLLSFSGDGSEVYWMNGNIPESLLFHAGVNDSSPEAEVLGEAGWLGIVSSGGRVAYVEPEPSPSVILMEDLIARTSAQVQTRSRQEPAWRTVPDTSICNGTVTGRLVYGDSTPAAGEWVQIAGMPGDPRGEEKRIRVAADGSFLVDGFPLGFHEAYARHARFEFTVRECGEIVDVGTVEYPLIHP